MLADRVQRIGLAAVKSRTGDVLTTVLGEGAGIPIADLIVDATANPTVATRLEQQRRSNRDAPARVTALRLNVTRARR